MALGDPYATLADLKGYLKWGNQTGQDAELTGALDSASREIESFCHRQFNREDVAAAREVEPDTRSTVDVDDFWTILDLEVRTSTASDGVYDELWAATDYVLWPVGGIVDGQPGWPFSEIRAKTRRWPQEIQVTARWGWAAVPAPIKQACLILAAQNFRLADAPFGVAGFGEFGVVRVKDIPQVESKLSRYIRHPVLVG